MTPRRRFGSVKKSWTRPQNKFPEVFLARSQKPNVLKFPEDFLVRSSEETECLPRSSTSTNAPRSLPRAPVNASAPRPAPPRNFRSPPPPNLPRPRARPPVIFYLPRNFRLRPLLTFNSPRTPTVRPLVVFYELRNFRVPRASKFLHFRLQSSLLLYLLLNDSLWLAPFSLSAAFPQEISRADRIFPHSRPHPVAFYEFRNLRFAEHDFALVSRPAPP